MGDDIVQVATQLSRQPSEDVAFKSKAVQDLVRVHAAFDELDCNRTIEMLVGAAGPPDGACGSSKPKRPAPNPNRPSP